MITTKLITLIQLAEKNCISYKLLNRHFIFLLARRIHAKVSSAASKAFLFLRIIRFCKKKNFFQTPVKLPQHPILMSLLWRWESTKIFSLSSTKYINFFSMAWQVRFQTIRSDLSYIYYFERYATVVLFNFNTKFIKVNTVLSEFESVKSSFI